MSQDEKNSKTELPEQPFHDAGPFMERIESIKEVSTELKCIVYVVDFAAPQGDRMVMRISKAGHNWENCR